MCWSLEKNLSWQLLISGNYILVEAYFLIVVLGSRFYLSVCLLFILFVTWDCAKIDLLSAIAWSISEVRFVTLT